MRVRTWVGLLSSLALVILASNIGATAGSFVDREISRDNIFQAWGSLVWVQSTRSDFEAGVLYNADAASSPGDVKLGVDSYAEGNLILFWDSATIPSGWTCISDEEGEDFYHRFPRGGETYGTKGGALNHTHTVTLISCSVPSETIPVQSGQPKQVSTDSHTHVLSSGAVSSESNLPLYRDLKIIRYNNGTPANIPAGAIAIFDTAPPSGWTRYNIQDNYFLRGAESAGTTGGSNTHSHTVDITLAPSESYTEVRPGLIRWVSSEAHTHTASGITESVDSRPPFITVILAKADSDSPIPHGMIGMFDAPPGGSWTVLSGAGGPFYSRFIVGNPTYGITGGNNDHTHPNLTLTTAEASSDYENARIIGNDPVAVAALRTHTHDAVVGFSDAINLPPYCEVIFARAGYFSSGTLASQVLDSGIPGANWNLLAWDETLSTNTDITFEVRASNAPFAKDAALPSWTAVGGTSPVTQGLPTGRYKQWRATLTTSNPSKTPVLHEVRVYYYRP
jgi:hypothetical protein